MAEALTGTTISKVEAQDMAEGDNVRVYEPGVQDGTWHKVVTIRSATLPCLNCGMHGVDYLVVAVEDIEAAAFMNRTELVKVCR